MQGFWPWFVERLPIVGCKQFCGEQLIGTMVDFIPHQGQAAELFHHQVGIHRIRR